MALTCLFAKWIKKMFIWCCVNECSIHESFIFDVRTDNWSILPSCNVVMKEEMGLLVNPVVYSLSRNMQLCVHPPYFKWYQMKWEIANPIDFLAFKQFYLGRLVWLLNATPKPQRGTLFKGPFFAMLLTSERQHHIAWVVSFSVRHSSSPEFESWLWWLPRFSSQFSSS